MRLLILLALLAVYVLVGCPSNDGVDRVRRARVAAYWRRIEDALYWPAGWLGGALPWSRL